MRTHSFKALCGILTISLLLVSFSSCGNGGSAGSQLSAADGTVAPADSSAVADSTTTFDGQVDTDLSRSSDSQSTSAQSKPSQNGVEQSYKSTTSTASKKLTTTTKADDNFTGATYYVSSSLGDDGADGTSPETPVKSLKAAGQLGGFGDRVLFKRGDVWRGQKMDLRSGVTYGAYGTGANPQFYGSAQNYAVKSKWKQSFANARVWYYDEVFPMDIGGIVFNEGADWAVRVFNESDINSKNKFYYGSDKKVYLFSRDGNPADKYSSIEFLPDIMIMNSRNLSDVMIKDVDFKYVGRMGIYGEGTTKNVRVENCSFIWMGGVLWGGSNGTVRLGNGIGLWGDCINYVVTNCTFDQIYDTAFTPQYSNAYATREYLFENIEFSNNTVNRCQYGVEIWLETKTSAGQNVGKLKNLRIVNNVMRNAGQGWSGTQRGTAASVSMAGHIETMGHEFAVVSDVLIKGNVFDSGAVKLLGVRWENYIPTFEGNTYIQAKGKDLGYVGGPSAISFDDNVKSKILAFDKTAKVTFSK